MMPRAKPALLYGVMGLIGGSFALGNEPQVSTSHSQHAAPDPNEDTSSEAPPSDR